MARSSSWLVTPDKFLTPEQVRVLRAHMDAERAHGAAVDDKKAVRDAAIVETLLGTGLRVSEACSLLIGDLFLDQGGGNVIVRHGKGNKARMVAIGDRLAAYLGDFIAWKETIGEPVEASSPVFLSERKAAMSRSAVHRVWKAALGRAELPTRWGVHATRHSYAVEVYRKTKDLRLTQRLLGHASPTTTMVYASLLDDSVRAGVAMVWA